jgi:hypothetical protein
VVRAGVARRALLVRAVEALERVQARVLGVTLNDITRSVRSYYYYYDHYSQYYAEEGKEPSAKPAPLTPATRTSDSIWPSVKRQANPFELQLVGEPKNNGLHGRAQEKTS